MTQTNATDKWIRVCPGLYVDPSNSWVISREARSWYSIRELTGWGPRLSGDMFPDYDDIWHGDYTSLNDAKNAVELMVNADRQPQ